MLYELTTISGPPLEQTAVSAAARNWVLDGEGRLVGAWRTELGELFQIKLLRGFETAEALERERLRALMSAHPFSIDDPSSRLSMERYARFPFLPDVEPLALGGFYEFRTWGSPLNRSCAGHSVARGGSRGGGRCWAGARSLRAAVAAPCVAGVV